MQVKRLPKRFPRIVFRGQSRRCPELRALHHKFEHFNLFAMPGIDQRPPHRMPIFHVAGGQYIQHGQMQRSQGFMPEIERGQRLEILFDQPRMIEKRQHDCCFAQGRMRSRPRPATLYQRGTHQAVGNRKAPAAASRSAAPASAFVPAVERRIALPSALIPLTSLTEESLRSVAHILAVVAANIFIGDAAGNLAQPRFKLGPAFRRIEYTARRFPRPHHIDQRLCVAQDRVERGRPFRLDEIVRVLPLRQKRETQRLAGLQGR